MIREVDELIAEVTSLHMAGAEVALGEFIAQCPADNDSLGDLVDADAQWRVERGLPVLVERYVDAIPDLFDRPEVLDAVLSKALDALIRERGCTKEQAVEALSEQLPALAEHIRVAGLLSEFMWSTETLRRCVVPERTLELPCSIGPPTPGGVPRYEARRLVGRGAHGAVYEGVDRLLSDRGAPAWVAIKVLHSITSEEGRAQFDAEARKTRAIDHENVVRVLDLGRTADGESYLVTELLQGGALTRESVPTAQEAVLLLVDVARGVQAAHTARLVHRDIKPANILLARDGVPKISDFGLAAWNDAGQAGELPPGGTLAFMAPEQYRGEESASNNTVDVYAMGGVLYWLLTGRPPNGATAGEVRAFLGGEGGAGVRPSDLVPVDADLDAICARALEADPALRQQSADQFAADLTAWLDHRPIEWASPTRARRARLLVRRRPLGMVGVVLLVAACIGVVSGFVYINQRHARERQASEARAEAEALRADLAAANERAIEAEYNSARDGVAKALKAIQATLGEMDRDWLPIVTVLESMAGPLVTSRDEAGSPLWGVRIRVVEDMLAEAGRLGQGDDLDTTIWRIVQSYWLLRDGRLDESLDAVRVARARWEGAGWPATPWVEYMRVIEAGGVIAASTPDGTITDAEAVLSALADLREVEGTFVGPREGSQLHLVLLRAMARGGLAVDRPELVRYARLRLEQLGG